MSDDEGAAKGERSDKETRPLATNSLTDLEEPEDDEGLEHKRRLAAEASEEARQEKLAELAAIDAKEASERAENKRKAVALMDGERAAAQKHLEEVDAAAERERSANEAIAKAAVEAERQEQVEVFLKEGVQPSSLPLATMKAELEQKSTAIEVKHLADREREERLVEIDDQRKINEENRRLSERQADLLAEQERDRLLQVDRKAEAQGELERRASRKETIQLAEAERQRRLSGAEYDDDAADDADWEEEGLSRKRRNDLQKAGVFDVLEEEAEKMESKTKGRLAKVSSEEARREKMADLAAIDLKEEQLRAETKVAVLEAVEVERKAQVRENARIDADNERERKLNAVRVKKAAETERQRLVAEYGEAPRASPLAGHLPEMANALEKNATTILVKQLADAEQADRIALAIQGALEEERLREANRAAVDAASEDERRRLVELWDGDQQHDDDDDPEALKETIALAEETERQRRMSEESSSSCEGGGGSEGLAKLRAEVFDVLEDEANEMERKTNRRVAKVLSEEARKEKMAELAAIDLKEEQLRAETKVAVLEAVEAERAEILRELRLSEADAKRERSLNAVRAKRASETEQRDRVTEFGASARPTALAPMLETLKPEMERRSTAILAKNLAEEERRDRIDELRDEDLANEKRRKDSEQKADALAEQERDRLLQVDRKADAQVELERRASLEETIAATEAERQRRLSEEEDYSEQRRRVSEAEASEEGSASFVEGEELQLKRAIFEAIPEKADEFERKTNERLAKVSSEEARKEKMAELAAIDLKESQLRADTKAAVVASFDAEQAAIIKELQIVEADAKRERSLNAVRAKRASESERAARVAAYGHAPRPTALAPMLETLKPAMERKSTSILVKNLADAEQRDRVMAAIECELANEKERDERRKAADRAAEDERQRLLQIEKKATAQVQLERESALRETVKATEAERQRRLAEEKKNVLCKETPLKSAGIFDLLPAEADAMHQKKEKKLSAADKRDDAEWEFMSKQREAKKENTTDTEDRQAGTFCSGSTSKCAIS